MKLLTVIVGVLLLVAVVNCRHYAERTDTEESSDETDHITKARDFAASQMRHRRKRWQNNYGYDYPPPPMPYYPDRRDYDRNNQDLLPQILRLLDEIATYVKRPPPPPQPIYVPYPVPYPVPQPQFCSCPKPGNETNPDVKSRGKPYEDSNQNWGLVESNDSDYDEGDGSRPISFEPIKPRRPMRRPTPKVDHGSTQESSRGNVDLQTQASSAPDVSGSLPSTTCNIAILSCCNDQQQKVCFTKYGCAMTFSKGNACSTESINAALDSFKVAYAPTY